MRNHAKDLQRIGKTLLFTEAGAWWQQLIDAGVDREAFYADDDFALEHGEKLLLAQRFPHETWDARMPLGKCALFAGLSPDAVSFLERLLVCRTFRKGQTIVAAGQASDEVFVITQGTAMVSIPTRTASRGSPRSRPE